MRTPRAVLDDLLLAARQQGMDTRHALESIGQPGTAVTTHPYNLPTDYQQSTALPGTSGAKGNNG